MYCKRNILLVINSDLINAGVPNVVMTIVRNLSEKFTFDIITYHSKKGQYDAEFESYGGKIFRLSLLDYSKHKILYPFRRVQIKRFMRHILKDNKYDVIHCHNGIESGVFLECAKKKGIPIRISHAHGTYIRKGNNKILLRYYSRCKELIKQNSTHALACSNKAGNSLFISGNFVNVLNPIDVSLYRGLVKNPHNGCNLLQIGYFSQNKNQLFSIKLLKSLLDEKMDVRLTFIGFPQEEEYYNQMLKTIDDAYIKESVRFLPRDADKAEVFKETDIVLLPSFTEGLPLVALEAQSARVPCILSDHVSEDANIGLAYYAKYDDIEEWKTTVRKAYNDKNNADTRGVNTDMIEINGWCDRIGATYNEQ